MIVLHGSGSTLLNCRFAVSPLWETMGTVRAVLEGRYARAAAGPGELDVLAPFVPRYGYAPDFLNPPPDVPVPDVEDELRRVAAVPTRRVEYELERALSHQPAAHTRLRSAISADPDRVRAQLVEALRAAWTRLIAPGWSETSSVLLADVRHRGQRLAERGLAAVLPELDSSVHLAGTAITVDGRPRAERELDGRGLLLLPSAFGAASITVMTDRPWHPMLVYRARGAGRLDESMPPPANLSALVGPGRAAVLAALDQPMSTTRLAGRLARSASTVSRHLAILHSAGLVRRYRDAHDVLYYRTDLGDQLLRRPAGTSRV